MYAAGCCLRTFSIAAAPCFLKSAVSARRKSRLNDLRVASNDPPGLPRRIGAVIDRDPLSQVDRLIADCKKRIARQREVVASAFQEGGDTPRSLYRCCEPLRRAFEPREAPPTHP